MARQRFFPRQLGAQSQWFGNFARQLHVHGAALGLTAPEVASVVADALFLAYATGVYAGAARAFAKSATAAVKGLRLGAGAGAQPLPGFVAPPLPGAVGSLPATVPVPAGAQRRVMKYVELIKARMEYTTAVGSQLGIIGAGEAAARPVPSFTLELVTGAQGQQVRIKFKKFGRKGVVIFSRRAGGEWEQLGIDLASPFVDRRPNLAAGQPEAREYRLRFFEDDSSTGEYTPVASVIVGG